MSLVIKSANIFLQSGWIFFFFLWNKIMLELSTMNPCTAIKPQPECTGSLAPMSLVQTILHKWPHSCLRLEMAQIGLFDFEWVQEKNRTCQPGRDQQGNKRSLWFLPRGVVLANIHCFCVHWFDSQCRSPQTMLRTVTEKKLHKVLCQISFGVSSLWTCSLCWNLLACVCMFAKSQSAPGSAITPKVSIETQSITAFFSFF